MLVLNYAVFHVTMWNGTPENITNLQLSMDVNFFSLVTPATHALPALEKSNGSIRLMNTLFSMSHSAVCFGNVRLDLANFFQQFLSELLFFFKRINPITVQYLM